MKTLLRSALAALGLALAMAALPAFAQSSPCPANMTSYFNLPNGGSIKCTCPAMAGGRTVWGSDRYTVDSDVCRAAVHAGAVPASGGEATVTLAEGCPIFRGAPKNGVQSTNYGPYGRTYHFTKDAPACQVQTKDDPVAECPFSMSVFASMKPGQSWRCNCTAARLQSLGTVYGTDRYTTDSSLCTAALHAGVVQPAGGEVTAHTGPGCARFPASAKNGVTSREWGQYGASYAFKTPLPDCAN
jgi:hypothetical protein